jgi:RNA polymerase sigma factor (sigma-70 family)
VAAPDVDAILEWRSSHLDDNSASVEAWTQFPQVLSRIIGEGGRHQGILDDPEDAIQEAWLVVLQGLWGFPLRDRENLRAWLAVVIRNRLSNLRRREWNRREAPLSAETTSLLVGREEDPATEFARQWVVEAVRAALEEARGHLSETSYRVVRLKWLDGWTTFEIAESLGLSAAQVRDRDRRALPVLGGLLKRRMGSELVGLFGEEFESSRRIGESIS